MDSINPYTDLQAVIEIVKRVAHEELLVRFISQEKYEDTYLKNDGSLVTEADLAVQEKMFHALRYRWPATDFLAEEMTLEEQQHCLENFESTIWCLDPLDGSSNFAAGLPFFSVSLGLIDQQGIALGIVYDPIRDECFSALRSQGAWLNNHALLCRSGASLLNESIALVDFKRLDSALISTLIHNSPYRSQRNLGSVALEWCWLASNRCDLYLHGKQKLWDYCAGSLILSEAGGCSSALSGEAVFQMDKLESSVIAARDTVLFKKWAEYLNSTY